MPSDYIVVFDTADAGYKALPFVLAGLVMVVLSIVAIVFPNALTANPAKRPGRAFQFIFLGFSVIWTVFAFIGSYTNYQSARDARLQQHYQVIEGRVHAFRPMPSSGHAMERFCVREVCFEYSDFVITSGFNNTASHGGPIREGLPVRVYYVDDLIVRLEVAKAALSK